LHQYSGILPSEASTTVEGLKLDLGFVLRTSNWRFDGLILGSQVDLWAEVLECYSSSEDSVGYVLIKFRAQAEGRIGSNINSDSFDTVGERTDALPSAPGELAFRQTTGQKGNFIHKRSLYKGGVDRP
jgi:hypothetical protein